MGVVLAAMKDKFNIIGNPPSSDGTFYTAMADRLHPAGQILKALIVILNVFFIVSLRVGNKSYVWSREYFNFGA